MELDADGDLVVPRRSGASPLPPGHQPADEEEEDEKDDKEEDVHLSEVHMERLHKAGQQGAATVFTTAAGQAVAAIEHSMATPLRSVGLQVWRGALLLADYLLHRGAAALDGITALELGAGPGLTGLVLAQLAAGGRIFLTDAHKDVLANCQRNAERNQPAALGSSSVRVLQLDWLAPSGWLLPGAAEGAGGGGGGGPGGTLPVEPDAGGGFAWQAGDRRDLQRLDLLLAADCIYDDTLTEAFMRTAVLLMRHVQQHGGRSPRLLVGLERRVVFTLTDMAARAPAYDHWRSLFEAVEREPPRAAGAAAAAAAVAPAAAVASAATCAAQPRALPAPAPPPFPLVGWRLDASAVPQAIQQYDRTDYLELWELALTAGP